jgi:hypothetical protein
LRPSNFKQILNKVVESPLLTFVCEIDTWLFDIEFIQISAFFQLLIIGFTVGSMLKSDSGFEIIHATHGHWRKTILKSVVHDVVPQDLRLVLFCS